MNMIPNFLQRSQQLAALARGQWAGRDGRDRHSTGRARDGQGSMRRFLASLARLAYVLRRVQRGLTVRCAVRKTDVKRTLSSELQAADSRAWEQA
jgi:hypothetical protein